MQSPLKSTDGHLSEAHRQLATQQQELDRLRQETYMLKETHQGLHQQNTSQLHDQAAKLQETVSAYKQQLTASQQHVQSLHHELNTLRQQQADAERSAVSQAPHLVLQAMQCVGQSVFVDKSTGHVYVRRASDQKLQHSGRWSKHAGPQLDGKVPLSAGLSCLQNFAASQPQRLKQTFDLFYSEHLGSVSISAVPALLAKLLPSATSTDAQLILSHLAVSVNERLTLPELLAAVEASLQASDTMALAAAAVPQEFQQLCARLQQRKQELCDLFGVYDTQAVGALEMRQIAQLLRRLLHHVTDLQLGQLVAQLHLQGVHSAASLQDLFNVARMGAAPRLHSGMHVRSAVNASPAAVSNVSLAELQHLQQQLAQLKQTAQQQLHACNTKDAELYSAHHAIKKLQQELHKAEKQRIAPPGPPAAQHDTSVSESQMRAAWDKANVLKSRFVETRNAFEQLKAQHARVVQVGFKACRYCLLTVISVSCFSCMPIYMPCSAWRCC